MVTYCQTQQAGTQTSKKPSIGDGTPAMSEGVKHKEMCAMALAEQCVTQQQIVFRWILDRGKKLPWLRVPGTTL